jgi:hypothetical protein
MGDLYDGVWIGWLDLFITPLQSLVITITLQPNSSSWTAEDSLHSDSVLYYLYSLEADP